MKNYVSLLLLLTANTLFAQNNAILPAKTATTTTLIAPAGTTAQAIGAKCGTIVVSVDSSIRVAPKFTYLSVDFSNITGCTQIEILSGNNIFWVFDKAGKQVVIKEKFLKSVKAAMGENIVNMVVKIPFKLKTDKTPYTIHYKWESKDKRKSIDLLTTK